MLRTELSPSWLYGKHLATWAVSPACFHSWHQSMRGDTRKRTVIHCANTYPTLLFLLLLSSVVTIHSEQLKASALQTSGGTRWWECNAAQNSHNQKHFPEHRRDFLQRAVTTSVAIRPLAYFWWHKFIKKKICKEIKPTPPHLVPWLDNFVLLGLLPRVIKHEGLVALPFQIKYTSQTVTDDGSSWFKPTVTAYNT